MNQFLDEDRRKRFNAALEDYSRLVGFNLDFKQRAAEVVFTVSPDSETEKVTELEDLTWRNARDRRYTFRLGNVSRMAISTGEEELPPEIAAVRTPSAKFFAFVASIFEDSGIFEWQCFPRENSVSQCPYGGSRWSMDLAEADPDAQCYCELFKHRQNALWTIGFWFQTFQIDSYETISVDEFLSQYPKRIGLKVP